MKNIKKIRSLFLMLFLFVPFVVSADTLPEPPQIISRAQWQADESLATSLNKAYAPEYPEKVEKIIVHHTASASLEPDTDGSGLYTGMMRNMFYFHTVYRQWFDENGESQTGFGDIGYNYVIDPNGNIYEGRSGGNGVIGAHAQGFNTGSIGIAVIGTYGGTLNGKLINDTLNTKTKAALEKLVGWLAANNNIDIKSQSLFRDKMMYGVVGHRDVSATQCPGDNIYSALAQIRDNSATLAATYSNYAYQASGGSDYYIFKNGHRFTYNSLADLQSFNPNYTKIANLPVKQIQAFQISSAPKYANGSLLRMVGDAAIYLLENGSKRKLSVNADQFANLGFKWSDVKDVLESDMSFFSNGLPIKYGTDGKLVSDISNNVYKIEQGKLKKITSATLFNLLKLSWSKIEKLNENDFKSYLTEGIVSYPNETIIKGNSPTVYEIENGQKKPITSLTLFNTKNYSWNNVLQSSDEELTNYNTASPVAYPDGTLVAAGAPEVYVIKEGIKKVFTSAFLFENLGYKWSDILHISNDELAIYNNGGYMKYADGTLLKAVDGYKVYILENGQKKWIQTAAEFAAGKYNWANIRLTSSSDLDVYPDLGSNVETVVPATPSAIPAEAGISTSTQEILNQVQDDNILMKVSLGNFTKNVSISANNGGYKVYENDQLIDTKKTGEIYTANIKNDLDILFVPDSSSAIMVIYGQDGFTYGQAHPFHSGYGGATDNRFRGNIRLKYSANSNKYWIINELPMEDYVNGIGEANNSDNSTYLQAFSIMIRSYAYHYVDLGGKHPNEPFYLKNSLNGNGNDQIYKGYGFEERAQNIVAANKAVQGMIATYNEKPIRAAYSSDSGGSTWDAREPHYIYYSNGKLVHTSEKPAVSNFYTVWGGEAMYDQFPYLYGGMPDPAGTTHDNSKIIISHGVGVSTTGARKMAENGKSYTEILKYYYPGIEIQ